MGRIIAISVSKTKGKPKDNIESARFIENWGIEGDVHAGDWHRQISLLAIESINKMDSAGKVILRPGIFAENLTIEGLELSHFAIGSRISAGKDCILEITQIGKECHNRCGIFNSVGDCVMPREGIFARVVRGGLVEVNDNIEIVKAEAISC
jgi:MOSC domain-containing protein YiiM